MGFKCDYKELSQYEERLEKLEGGFNWFLKGFITEIAERIIATVKPKTPKVTGALRNAWQIEDIRGAGKTLEIEIKNPMEYATEVEYGHRLVDRNGNEIGWVDGRFMLSVSIEYVTKQIPLRYAKSLKQFCDRLGI